MNLYLHELKTLRRATIAWTLALIALCAMYLSVYPSIMHDAAVFRKMLQGYPPVLRAMLGVRLNSLTSLNGFYSMTISFVVLCGGIQAMHFGLSVLSRETRERTADFLLTKPVTRAAVVTAKLLAGFSVLLITSALYGGGALLMAHLVKPSGFNLKVFALLCLTLPCVQLIFFALGFAVSVFFGRLRSPLPLSLGVVFALYFIGVFLAAGKHASVVRFFSPFEYFKNDYILAHAAYEPRYCVAGAVVTAVCVLVSYVVYLKKDIHAVS